MDGCNDYRPYPQSMRTLTLGCVNCGYAPFSHDNYCVDCMGTGRIKENDVFDDLSNCLTCNGSGRADGTFWVGAQTLAD